MVDRVARWRPGHGAFRNGGEPSCDCDSPPILICVLGARKLQLAPPRSSAPETSGPRPSSIVRFGLVQLVGMIGLNAAGWWIASLVARADITLAQAGWFSVAMQLRNMCGMPAWLISQSAYAQLTETGARGYGGPGRVTALSTIVATLISLLVIGPMAALMPWIVPRLYGSDFAGAEFAATLAVATGLIHMSAAPAAARLTVVIMSSSANWSHRHGAWSVAPDWPGNVDRTWWRGRSGGPLLSECASLCGACRALRTGEAAFRLSRTRFGFDPGCFGFRYDRRFGVATGVWISQGRNELCYFGRDGSSALDYTPARPKN